jgi:hypothetical protein
MHYSFALLDYQKSAVCIKQDAPWTREVGGDEAKCPAIGSGWGRIGCFQIIYTATIGVLPSYN